MYFLIPTFQKRFLNPILKRFVFITFLGNLAPSSEERAWWASRVEGYRCPACDTALRFPRYNHPEKLLETRTGEDRMFVERLRAFRLTLCLILSSM